MYRIVSVWAVFFSLAMFLNADDSVESQLDIGSGYVWRGITQTDGLSVQPSISAMTGYFGFRAWGNSELEKYDEISDEGIFSEIDITFLTAFSDGFRDYEIGFIDYVRTRYGVSTRDIYGIVSWDLVDNLKFHFGLYYDIDEYSDFYANTGLAWSFNIGSLLDAKLSGDIGFMGKDESLGEKGGLNEYTFALDMAHSISTSSDVNVKVAYTSSFNTKVLPEQSIDFYLVAGLRHSL